MMRIPFESIVERIQQHANLPLEEVNARIKAKMDQLSGLISKEGAAHIIANEIGMNLLEAASKACCKIKEIAKGSNLVSINGRIISIYDIREFQRKDGTPGKVGSLFVADETGRIRVTL